MTGRSTWAEFTSAAKTVLLGHPPRAATAPRAASEPSDSITAAAVELTIKGAGDESGGGGGDGGGGAPETASRLDSLLDNHLERERRRGAPSATDYDQWNRAATGKLTPPGQEEKEEALVAPQLAARSLGPPPLPALVEARDGDGDYFSSIWGAGPPSDASSSGGGGADHNLGELLCAGRVPPRDGGARLAGAPPPLSPPPPGSGVRHVVTPAQPDGRALGIAFEVGHSRGIGW